MKISTLANINKPRRTSIFEKQEIRMMCSATYFHKFFYLRISATSGLRYLHLASCYHLFIHQLCDRLSLRPMTFESRRRPQHPGKHRACVSNDLLCQYSESSASVFIVSCRDVLSSEAAAGNHHPAASCSALTRRRLQPRAIW